MTSTQPHHSERIHHQVALHVLVNELKTCLPDSAIIAEPEALRPYECDGLSAYRCLPWLVVLPATVAQVQHCVRCCYRHGVPIVARGAGTGLAGGALPLDNGVLLSLVRLNRILDIDSANRLARVEPGVRNLAISQAAASHGLYYAPDPSSQIACTIGGNVAENSGGVHCLKYGLTTHNILQLDIITMDGELVTIGSHGLDGPGLDLLALMTGSEGMLGIVVAVTVKLLPLPEQVQVVLAAFDDVEQAGLAVAEIIAAGLIPAGLEMMDKATIKAAEDFIHAGYPEDAEAILLCELDGSAAQVDEELELAVALLAGSGASHISIAKSEQERKRLWAGRKAAFPAIGRLSPDYYCMDGTIPRRFLATVLKGIAELSEHYGLAVANVFHAGDGNLHPLILYNADLPGDLQKAEQFGGDILKLSIAVGGTISGEHGVGIEKINHMCMQFSTQELTQFHAIKRAFDGRGLLNPGKAIPTLSRCAEFGAMHVHHGQLPHPGIDRF
ncbi:MAG: FAD-linked oxidase C-terminal domain-containing protein [Methylovulum sp.]|nr:FAD-linked oxidase C-terminal domain-containing protein [Methylovulum sp.]